MGCRTNCTRGPRRRLIDTGSKYVDLRVTEDGQEALGYLYRRDVYAEPEEAPRPDLVLLDLNLPKVNGTEVLKQIRAASELRSIPVVMLTTSKRDEDVQQSYDIGCNSYMTKSYDPDDLVESMRDLYRYWFERTVLPSVA